MTISIRTRAGLLVVACALVGGTGCITTALIDSARANDAARRHEVLRQQRIREATPRAEAGDPAAMTALADALMDAFPAVPPDVPRARAWLERAAEAGYAPAQVRLGEMLVMGRNDAGNYGAVDPVLRARGIVWLQKAASQACSVPGPHGRSMEAALYASRFLDIAGQAADARLWRARSVVHCGSPGADVLAARASSTGSSQQTRREALAMLMLTGDRARIEHARATLAPDDVAAAEREAAALARRVADSERDFPAPHRKDTP